MDIKETDILGEEIYRHWYYRSKAKALTKILCSVDVKTILDIGAGSGFFSKHLLSTSKAKEAWCVDINYDADTDLTEAGKPIYFRRSIDSIDADLVLLMDVLEHVVDDIGLLRSYVSKVPKRTLFLISVPAFQFLWSRHDIFLEHKRRYRLNEIEDVVKRAGLTVKHSAYYFGAVFPLAATMRLAGNMIDRGGRQKAQSQLKKHHPLVNEILATMSHMELKLMNHNRLAGLTVFCLAESR